MGMNKNDKTTNAEDTEALETQAAPKQGKSLEPFFGLASIALSVVSFAVTVAIRLTSAPENFGAAIASLLLSCLIAVISVVLGVIGLNRKEPPIYSAIGIIGGLMMLLAWVVMAN
jgi:hypothetical protein